MPRSLEAQEEQLIRCSRCGACQSVCPVFKELQSEAMVARGKLKLIRGVLEKTIPLTEGFAERMSWCLMCRACYENCASSVRTDRIVEAARAEIIRCQGIPCLEKVIFHFGLKNRWVFNAGMRMGGVCQWLLFRKGPEGQVCCRGCLWASTGGGSWRHCPTSRSGCATPKSSRCRTPE